MRLSVKITKIVILPLSLSSTLSPVAVSRSAGRADSAHPRRPVHARSCARIHCSCALTLLHDSRRETRLNAVGELVLLEKQDRRPLRLAGSNGSIHGSRSKRCCSRCDGMRRANRANHAVAARAFGRCLLPLSCRPCRPATPNPSTRSRCQCRPACMRSMQQPC